MQTGLPAITFAGLQYFIAFLCLTLLVLFNPTHRNAFRAISRATWAQLALLRILFYTITRGAYFIGLTYLPANTMSLVFNFAPVFVALASGLLIKESPSLLQWFGILLSITGALVFFLPLEIAAGKTLGFTAGLIGVLAYSASSLLGRHVNHKSGLSPILVTTISMGIGGFLLLFVGGITQGFSRLDLSQWLIIGWLAMVNTAFAFTIWNNTLRTLSAVEASIINNTILPQVAILAWLFLDEPLQAKQILAILLVMVGTLVVQLQRHASRDDMAGTEIKS